MTRAHQTDTSFILLANSQQDHAIMLFFFITMIRTMGKVHDNTKSVDEARMMINDAEHESTG